ncbi:hypothetical protein Q5P01_010712 [Channa striata]|uniref:DNA-directed DNA polymerase n=1 Tax=Channa striata TaxID=64152 RepID=A0AA88MVK1_CHASR|nr:hypothetical protein Q5P01_010712 [Channa striata]
MSAYRGRLMKILSEGQKDLCKQSGRVSIPALAGDMLGQEHEITCVSLVIVNSHLPKPGPGRHRKKLIVVYNKRKSNDELHPEVDHELATGSGVESASRIAFYPCSGELALLEKRVELLYVYNAEFDVRVMEQRVHFYTESNYAKGADPATRKRCSALLGAWRGLFVTRSLSEDLPPFFQFESMRYLEMYRDMLTSVGSVLSRGKLTEWKLRLAASHVEKFNKEKAKLGHFKMIGCGMTVVDLYRMTGTSMYPSIMCALNISPETTVPWPPTRFGHDLTGWVCYSWEAEGFEYASLILRYDRDQREFTRAPAVFFSSVEHYLNKRAGFKAKLKDPALSDVERVYYKMQEGECKVMANSFYGTAPLPCGPLISGHGRRQISVVNECVSSFYRHSCPVLYGETDSVMVSVGYGPKDPPEQGLRCAEHVRGGRDLPSAEDSEKELLEDFARSARAAVADKFKRAGSRVPEFLACVHRTLVEDTLKRMYVIERGNVLVRVIRDPEGGFTEQGYPVYVVRTPGSETLSDITRPFVKDRRVKLEYENSSSAYCHVAKKSYVSLTHGLDDKDDLSSLSVKIRGLSTVKRMWSPCDVRGWWQQLDQAASILAPHRVQRVVELQLEGVFSGLGDACGLRETESLSARREAVARLLGEKLEACLRVVTGDMSLSPGEVYESLSVELGWALAKASSEGVASQGGEDSTLFACSDARISLSLPASMFADAGLACPTGRLSLLRSEVSERALVDLAGVLYQTVLMLQIRSPRAFASVPGAYPDSMLCIMPYSREDPDLMRTWLEAFKGRRWLKPTRVKLGKRTALSGGELDRKEATYHCTGCKNFYRDLFVSKISGDKLFRTVYGSGNKRLLGHCVNEAWWIP